MGVFFFFSHYVFYSFILFEGPVNIFGENKNSISFESCAASRSEKETGNCRRSSYPPECFLHFLKMMRQSRHGAIQPPLSCHNVWLELLYIILTQYGGKNIFILGAGWYYLPNIENVQLPWTLVCLPLAPSQRGPASQRSLEVLLRWRNTE